MFGGQPVTNDEHGLGRRDDGTIAGAGIVLDEAIRRMVAAGMDPATVIASTTEVAARSLGRTDIGHIAIGAHADLVWWDQDWNPRRVWIAGHEVQMPGVAGDGASGTVAPPPNPRRRPFHRLGVHVEVIIVRKPEDAAPIVANAYSRLLAVKPDAVLGLATGSTPLGVYKELIRRHKEEGLSFARAMAFNLDEYVGLPAGHPELYRTFIEREFTGQVDFAPDAVNGPDGLAEDLLQAGRDYDQAIKDAGGIDIQILGIGSDGHLAFNMPGSSLVSRTRLKTLTDQDPRGQRPLLRRRHQPGAQALPHPGPRHDHGVPPRDHAGLRVRARPRPWPSASRAGCRRTGRPRSCRCTRTPPVVVDEEAAHQLRLTSYYTNTYEGQARLAGDLTLLDPIRWEPVRGRPDELEPVVGKPIRSAASRAPAPRHTVA